MPLNGEKRWIKKKGCKNCAKMWVVDGFDEDGEEYGRWFIVPMKPGKHFEYLSEPHNLGDDFQMPSNEQTNLVNIYFDPITKSFSFNKE